MKSYTVVIFSTKGGVGKTFLATNIAVGLSKMKKKTILLDLDLHAGEDMAKMLDLKAKSSLVDVIPSLEELNTLKGFLTLHPLSGLNFLPAISRPRQAPHIKPALIEKILKMLEEDFEYIIIDAGKVFSDILVSILDASNLVLYVVTPDILAVYQTKWGLDLLQSLNFPLRLIKFVLNRARSRGGVSIQEVKVVLPQEILASIPSEGKTVGLALNRGIPVILDSPKSRVSISLKDLVKRLTEEESLYVEHKEIKDLRIKKEELASSVSFWERLGMVEPLKKKALPQKEDELIKLKKKIHDRLLEELDLKRTDIISSSPEKMRQLREKTEKIISNLLAEETNALVASFKMRKLLVKEIADEALGLGPLEDLLSDPEVTDIMVNNKDEVYIERHGKLELTDKKFISNDQVRAIIERIIAPIGRRIDESCPMVDARLPDGSRVNAIIPPLSLTGPMLTIRKFARGRYTIDDLLKRFKSLSPSMAEFLRASVLGRKNIIVSGGTGSGKTTLLNILSAFIPDEERIITIEDAAELKLHQSHWARLESRPPNIEGKGAVTIRDLFRNSLRMRPDRIIIGECRGVETLDMLQAMNTGHDGSMTTIHANSTHDVLVRLDSMILMSGIELPIRAIREMIASAIDLIIHTARLSDGSRKVMQITEVAGMLDEIHINLKDIFVFQQRGIDEKENVLGEFSPTGYIPSFFEELQRKGISLPKEIFLSP